MRIQRRAIWPALLGIAVACGDSGGGGLSMTSYRRGLATAACEAYIRCCGPNSPSYYFGNSGTGTESYPDQASCVERQSRDYELDPGSTLQMQGWLKTGKLRLNSAKASACLKTAREGFAVSCQASPSGTLVCP